MQTYSHADLASYIEFSRGVSLSRRQYPSHHMSVGAFGLIYQRLIQQLLESENISGHLILQGKDAWSEDHLFVIRGCQVRVSPGYQNLGDKKKPVHIAHRVSVDKMSGSEESIDRVMLELRVLIRDSHVGVLLDDAERYLRGMGVPIPAGYVVETL